jgi:hypothetical protein
MSSVIWILTLIWLCVGVIWVLPLAAAIFEIVVGVAVMNGQYKPNAKTISILGLISAICCINIIGIVLESLSLANHGKPEVANWMAMQSDY